MSSSTFDDDDDLLFICKFFSKYDDNDNVNPKGKYLVIRFFSS